MVKEYVSSTLIDDNGVQEVFRAIWEDSSVWAGYHHNCDHPDAVVSPWQGNERKVTFSTPLKAPAFIKKLVGVEVLEIIETQLLHRQSDGSLEVESTPVLAAPGASKFTTHALFSMSETVNGRKSCKIEVRITCTCSVWGMQTTVEGMMVAQAEESMLKFLAWAKTQCIMFKQAGAPSASAKANVVVMGQDEFHDALESAAESASIALTSDRQDVSEEEEVQPEEQQLALRPADMSFEQAMLHYMAQMNDRLQDMAEDMAEIRKELVRMQRPRRQQASTQSFLLSPSTWFIGSALIAAGSYCCFVYCKPSRGSSQLL
ncbi:hypothetical protein ABBQ32_002305 [Trebouxia sp. C0010 RCD-2024]